MKKMIKVYEDNNLLVINKPAGMVVNRAKSVDSKTVQDWMVDEYPQIVENGEKGIMVERLGLAHRIDKQTSGALLLAKDEETLIGLMAQFKERKVEKKYLALVHNWFRVEEGEIRLPLGRLPQNKTEFGVVVGGKMSQTGYFVREKYEKKEGRYSLVELFPKTGRTHQIRVVMKHLGHPLVSDDKYLGKRWLKEDLSWCKRMFLHAWSISFVHPKTNKRIEVKTELPNDLSQALMVLNVGSKNG